MAHILGCQAEEAATHQAISEPTRNPIHTIQQLHKLTVQGMWPSGKVLSWPTKSMPQAPIALSVNHRRQSRAARTRVLGQELGVGVGVVLQLVGLDHDVGGGAEGAVDARRRGHDARVRQREAASLLPARQDHGRVAERLRGGFLGFFSWESQGFSGSSKVYRGSSRPIACMHDMQV